jgi:myosin VIIa
MGNIKYKGKVVDNLDATDIPDTSNVERVAAILGVQKQSLGRLHMDTQFYYLFL